MGLNDTAPNSTDPPEPTPLDDLAVYALDAVDLPEAVTVEALLATDPRSTEVESVFRAAAGELGAAAPAIDIDPPLDLRDRVITAAHGVRAPMPIDAASAVDVHRIELERAVMLFRRLDAAQWQAPVDPPEFEGWTVGEVVAHLASNAGLAAQSLDAAGYRQPETVVNNAERTLQVHARHQNLSPAETIDELETLAAAVDGAVRDLPAADLDREIPWWNANMRILSVLIIRSFETWTHCDDIRRACGMAQLPPPAPSLLAMSSIASTWTGIMMLVGTGRDYSGRSIELRLTGMGGGRYHVPLGFDEIDLTGVTPDAVVTFDLVDYCRALGDRFPEGGIPYEATGDTELALDLVSSLNALATL